MSQRPPSRSRRARVVALALAVAVSATARACSPGPSPAAFDGRLIALVGLSGSASLASIDGRGQPTTLPLTGRDLATIAVAADGRLAASTIDGRLLMADAASDVWRSIDATAIPAMGESDIALAAWSAGGELAFAVASLERAELAGVFLIDPGGVGRWIGLRAGFGGYPPAWLDPDRLAVSSRGDEDLPTVGVIDTAAGSVLTTVAGVRAVAAAEGGDRLAALATDLQTIEIRDGAAWLAGDDNGLLARITAAPDGYQVDAMALDPSGDLLAAASSGGSDGVEGSIIRVWSGADGWSVVLTVSLGRDGIVRGLGFSP